MKPVRWLLTTLGAFLLLAGVVILLNVWLDIYGIFRDTRNRHLVDYGDDRIAKYLLSEHYVPQNFEAILVGPSISSNWDTHGIHAIRTYNESLNGSNFFEQECLVNHALSEPGIRVVMIVIHPSLTAAHDFDTVALTDRENWGALGSVSLFEAYKALFARVIRHSEPPTDDYGTDHFEDPVQLNAVAAKMMTPGTNFTIDALAFSAFRKILDEARSHHAKVVYIIPPMLPAMYEPKREAFAKYFALLRTEMGPEEQVIDFSAPRLRDFQSNRSNFSDGVHISRKGTPRLVALLNQELTELREKGLL